MVNVITNPYLHPLSPYYQNKYKKLIYLNGVGKVQYLASPPWRAFPQQSQLPKHHNLYNLRSYWAYKSLSKMDNLKAASNVHSHLVESIYNNIYTHLLQHNYINLNHLTSLLEQLFIYDPHASLFQFVIYNMFYALALFLDFPLVSIFITKLLGLHFQQILSASQIQTLFQYLHQSHFFQDLSTLLIQNNFDIFLEKFRTNYKPIVILQPSEIYSQKDLEAKKVELEQRVKDYQKEQPEPKIDIDRVAEHLKQNKTPPTSPKITLFHLIKGEDDELNMSNNQQQLVEQVMNCPQLAYKIKEDKWDKVYSQQIRQQITRIVQQEHNILSLKVFQQLPHTSLSIIEDEDELKQFTFKVLYELKRANRRLNQYSFAQNPSQSQQISIMDNQLKRGLPNISINKYNTSNKIISINKNISTNKNISINNMTVRYKNNRKTNNNNLKSLKQSNLIKEEKQDNQIDERIYPQKQTEFSEVDMKMKQKYFEQWFVLQNESYNIHLIHLLQEVIEPLLDKQKEENKLLLDSVFQSPQLFESIIECYLFKVGIYSEIDQSSLNYYGTNLQLDDFQIDNSCLQAGYLLNRILNCSAVMTAYHLHCYTLPYLSTLSKQFTSLFINYNQQHSHIKIDIHQPSKYNNHIQQDQSNEFNHMPKIDTFPTKSPIKLKRDKSDMVQQKEQKKQQKSMSIYRLELLRTLLQIIRNEVELYKEKNNILDSLDESMLDALVLGFFQHSDNNIYTELFMQLATILLQKGGETIYVKLLFKVNLVNKLQLAYSCLVQNNVVAPDPPVLLFHHVLQLILMIQHYTKERQLKTISQQLNALQIWTPLLLSILQVVYSITTPPPPSTHSLSSNHQLWLHSLDITPLLTYEHKQQQQHCNNNTHSSTSQLSSQDIHFTSQLQHIHHNQHKHSVYHLQPLTKLSHKNKHHTYNQFTTQHK